jgi:neutral ceramidase
VRVLDTSQTAILRTGELRVKVTARRAGSHRVAIKRAGVTLVEGVVPFREPGTKTVTLPLAGDEARGAIERCRGEAPFEIDSGACNPDRPSPLKAGAASADITPPVGTPMFAYTARSGLANPGNLPNVGMQLLADPDHNHYAKTFVASRGIHTRVRARALVLQTARGKFALVQADLGGVPYALTQEVLKRIAATGIDGERLLLSATHTHSSTGPIWPADSTGYALLGGDLFDPRAFDVTAAGIAEAVIDANKRLEPARAGIATVPVTDATSNRSPEPFALNPEAKSSSPIDPDMTVLRVDSRDGQPLGAWSNFAIHPTSFGDGNLLFSGDNAAFAERLAEERMEDEATVPPRQDRPVANVWTNSNQGDISPRAEPRKVDGQDVDYAKGPYAGAHAPGARVADGIVRAWRDAGDRMQSTLDVDARRAFLDFDGTAADGEPVGPVPVLGAAGVTGPDGFCAPVDNLAGPGQGGKFPMLAGRGLLPSTVPVSVWRLGSLGVAAFPSEITKTMGGRIRSAIQNEAGGSFQRVALAGLTNAYVSYTATPEEYGACHYEGSFTLFGRRQGARWRDFALGLTRSLTSGAPAPAGAAEPTNTGLALADGLKPPEKTPDAGAVLEEPAASVTRRGLVKFRWAGGDAAVDAPRGAAFVTVERRVGGRWVPFATDDGFQDITERTQGNRSWTETFQFGDCDPLGYYRFHVRGRADRGDGKGAAPYVAISKPFELKAMTLALEPVTEANGMATVRAVYPDPGETTLMALPRLVRDGWAELRVGRRLTRTRADAERYGWVVNVRAGETVRVRSLADPCGNRATP